jgi:uncharacterized membrane protein
MNKWRNYGLWVAAAALVPLTASMFGVDLTPDALDKFDALVNGVLTVLVLAGIVSNPSQGSGFADREDKDN